jgi:hypothetical protein
MRVIGTSGLVTPKLWYTNRGSNLAVTTMAAERSRVVLAPGATAPQTQPQLIPGGLLQHAVQMEEPEEELAELEEISEPAEDTGEQARLRRTCVNCGVLFATPQTCRRHRNTGACKGLRAVVAPLSSPEWRAQVESAAVQKAQALETRWPITSQHH